MKAEKDPKTGKWLIQYRFTDWQGKRRKSTKRGFATKREAEEWLRTFLVTQKADFDMKFEEFLKMYYADMETRLREHTMRTKKYIIDLKILPYFGQKRVNDITAADIRRWQNELIKKGYSPTYLKTINNQLSAIFNYAVKYYDLKGNPCTKAGSIGKSRAEEMSFWTIDEFRQFVDCIMDKRQSYMSFMILYWTGMRLGELLALTPADIDLDKHTISITKSYQRLGKKDVVTPPKTPKSKRLITIPEFLVVDIKDYMDSLYEVQEDDRLFPVTKYFLEHEMQRGIKASGVKRIRIHDLRHSHASMLVELGFSPLEIADRLGHEKIETTLNTYSHLYPNKQIKIADRLDSEYKEAL
ncbi:site-specific integrase [Blautia sp. AF26-2]|uniref:site-specific integrase n=1 Tax=Blautia sp. AF26-2 TaxID=2292966 RepID=UPI000E53E4C3|nr:site-specific integrase [Blautia sp. AF26-2]RGG14917.1 site-specific integrase [Blautia sp. AF26-2]